MDRIIKRSRKEDHRNSGEAAENHGSDERVYRQENVLHKYSLYKGVSHF